MNMGKRPFNIAKAQAADYSWVGIYIRPIVVVYEIVINRLAEGDRNDARQQNAHDAGD
jgi:hypothetical protein